VLQITEIIEKLYFRIKMTIVLYPMVMQYNEH
jgi:hypothetical protein